LARSRINTRPPTTRPSIRRASLKDLDVLVDQRRAMWTDMGVTDQLRLQRADRAYKRWTRTRLRNHQLLGWLVENRDGKVAGGGCLWLQPIQPGPNHTGMTQPYLLSMYTSPEFRRRGVASMVVGQAIEWCKRRGYSRLRLHASEMGRPVYRQFGFKRGWEMRLDLEKTQPRTKARKSSCLVRYGVTQA
jgi:GNAT superfamily N-acetyltransferase